MQLLTVRPLSITRRPDPSALVAAAHICLARTTCIAAACELACRNLTCRHAIDMTVQLIELVWSELRGLVSLGTALRAAGEMLLAFSR
ncbi:hypothetical protein [Deinococcus marmoris]|uniref:hypothetical protein n=1 Tax=Deinococcus marmoris TaxID=249408 RepID=UPI00096AC25E|nr:hypothetical protein [Deinococcus marmoris]